MNWYTVSCVSKVENEHMNDFIIMISATFVICQKRSWDFKENVRDVYYKAYNIICAGAVIPSRVKFIQFPI